MNKEAKKNLLFLSHREVDSWIAFRIQSDMLDNDEKKEIPYVLYVVYEILWNLVADENCRLQDKKKYIMLLRKVNGGACTVENKSDYTIFVK